MTYLLYAKGTLVATGTDKDKNYHTFGIAAEEQTRKAKDGKPIFGCCTGPYQAGACACSNEAKPTPGGPDVVSMDR